MLEAPRLLVLEQVHELLKRRQALRAQLGEGDAAAATPALDAAIAEGVLGDGARALLG